MWSILLYILLVPLLLYLVAATVYLLVLAMAYLMCPAPLPGPSEPLNRFAILVPAHNEELLVGGLCESLLQMDYPGELFEIFVVADNCTDQTVAICRKYQVRVIEKFDLQSGGKGEALAFGLHHIDLDRFDAVFMVDADNYVDPAILRELNRRLNTKEQAIQCYNAVGNRDDSWFTQLLYVSRTIGNVLYHEAKYRLGLSSYLMGNGLCFTSELLRRKGWTAFTAGEDWEYYAQLVEENIKIGFAVKAKVFHQESRSLDQATSQRLRWSSGRFYIAKTLGLRLFIKGFRERNWQKMDASLPLLFPNYSLQINLTFGVMILSMMLPPSVLKDVFFSAGIGAFAGQLLLFLMGAVIAGAPMKIIRAALYAPVFLAWKSVIDFLCFFGLYKGGGWIRTKRHRSLGRTGR